MKMTRVENIEIVIAVYISLGVAIIHATLYNLIFSACCGLLSLAIMIHNRESSQKFEKYDSWGWSKAATKGSSVWVVIFFIGGLSFWQRLIYSYLSGYESLVIPYWEISMLILFSTMMGIAVYFRGYLKPVEGEITDPKSLELEHREWFGMFQAGAIFAGILIIATGTSYLTGLIKEVPLSSQAKMTSLIHVIQLFYIGVGYVGWILRPFHGRGKEIRDHLNKLKQGEGLTMQAKPRLTRKDIPTENKVTRKPENKIAIRPEGEKIITTDKQITTQRQS